MLQWVGKRPLRQVTAFPAQLVETFKASPEVDADETAWQDWPDIYPHCGLLFHGDNEEVLAHLLANGFRNKVKLIYIDPPYDSAADYVRKVKLRGITGSTTLEGESYTLGEQIQYSDIWSNDNYLQFMFERLMLLRELLMPNGSIWVHCDWHRSHHIRMLLDEVFGPNALQNEVVWQRTDPHNDAKSRLGWIHDTIFWYGKGDAITYNWDAVVEPLSDAALKEYSLVRLDDGSIVPYSPEMEKVGRRFKLDDCTYKGNASSRQFVWRGARPSDKRVWPYDLEGMDAALERGELYLRNPSHGAARCRVSYLDNREGQVLQTIWTECGRMKGGVEYPTQKPHALISRIIQAASNPGDLVLDCFIGSGTTAAVAQDLGRRWIGCDINKGAIQTTAKRLHAIIQEQAIIVHESRGTPTLPGMESEGEEPKPAQLSFAVYRVNDYDLQIQHNEAVNLACAHIGVTRTRSDAFFDGVLGTGSRSRLVKIAPFTHPLLPLDLETVKQELAVRPEESRDVVVVCLGKTLAVDAWLEEWNRLRIKGDFPNKIRVVELRTDPTYGKFIEHQPAQAMVSIERGNGKVFVRIDDFISPTIIERLKSQTGLLTPQIDDWRAMVDSIMIDTAYNGEVFNVVLADVPERKDDLVIGEYELDAPGGETTVAVKIADMLGEEVLQVERV